MMNRQVKYSVVGLGKLGCPMAVGLAKRGFEVIGVDINPDIVERIETGEAPIVEPHLQELLTENKTRIKATTDYREALLNSDVTFVILPSPSNVRGSFSLKFLDAAFREIGKVLAEKEQYHLVVISSTVLPGSTRYGLLPILERESGKRCGEDFGLCYCPELFALGTVIYDFLNPDFVIIGESDLRAGNLLEKCYSQILEKRAPCKRMSFENAELTKIALNSYITMKITFANMLAELCELIPGGNVDDVSDALGQDSRIGRKYLTGAVGYGGPCFPRDNSALYFIANGLGYQADLPKAIENFNRQLVGKLANRVYEHVSPGARIGILGLAYKPDTPVVEESQGILLANELARQGLKVMGFDPLANDEARKYLESNILLTKDMLTCIHQADTLVITTPDPTFKKLRMDDFPKKAPPIVIFDCWRILLNELSGCPHIEYIPIGIGKSKSVQLLENIWSASTTA